MQNYLEQREQAAIEVTNSNKPITGEQISVDTCPEGVEPMFSFMAVSTITNTASNQYKVAQHLVIDDDGLARTSEGDYVIAMGSGTFGLGGDNVEESERAELVGKRFSITFTSGTTLNFTIGDIKDAGTDPTRTYHEYIHEDGSIHRSYIEFLVDADKLNESNNLARVMGDIRYADVFEGIGEPTSMIELNQPIDFDSRAVPTTWAQVAANLKWRQDILASDVVLPNTAPQPKPIQTHVL
ncbi:MAG: hypothetical protein LBM38_01515 [Clostridiales bacterium]|nr:hypothetical protein [Clostridiales bacterium]